MWQGSACPYKGWCSPVGAPVSSTTQDHRMPKSMSSRPPLCNNTVPARPSSAPTPVRVGEGVVIIRTGPLPHVYSLTYCKYLLASNSKKEDYYYYYQHSNLVIVSLVATAQGL